MSENKCVLLNVQYLTGESKMLENRINVLKLCLHCALIHTILSNIAILYFRTQDSKVPTIYVCGLRSNRDNARIYSIAHRSGFGKSP